MTNSMTLQFDFKQIEKAMPIKKDIQAKMNKHLYMDGMKLLSKLDDDSIRCAFFDPQYGLRGKRVEQNVRSIQSKTYKEKKRIALPQMTDRDINFFIRMYHRKLIWGGFLFIWLNSDCLINRMNQRWLFDDERENVKPDGYYPKGFAKTLRHYDNMLLNTKLEALIVWPKEQGGLGYLIRNQCEYVVVMRKVGIPQVWLDKRLDKKKTKKKPVMLYSDEWNNFDQQVWHEKIRNRRMLAHPHTKPLLLQSRLIEACTYKGDLVVDAAAGSFSILKACELTGRNFLGCDKINKTFIRPQYAEGV